MAQSRKEVAAILEQAGLRPNRRLGQNFMIDRNMVRAVVEAGSVAADDAVIEVGPGTGVLTEELLARGAAVLAVEVDRGLSAALLGRLGGEPRLRIVAADALPSGRRLHAEIVRFIAAARDAGRAPKLVANLPYCIASPLIIELLIEGVDILAFTVQCEVAQRLRAAPGSADYGVLSVMAQLLAKASILRTIPPEVFWPAPHVQSALVRMERNDDPPGDLRQAAEFFRRLFSARRKTLRNALATSGFDPGRVLDVAGFDGTARGEDLSPQELLRLYRAACQCATHAPTDGPA